MRLLSPVAVRALLDAHGVRPSRALGQNFLADPNTARRIVRLAGVGPDHHVLEIGAGVGSLTLALAETGASVKALEVDRHLLPVLAEVLAGADNVEVVRADALTVDYGPLLGCRPSMLVANLPYNVATPLVVRLLEAAPQLDRMVVMVQKEVAERLAAPPGTPACGAVSTRVAYHCTARTLARVPPTVFIPRPRVESAVIGLQRRAVPPVEVPDPEPMFALARAGFGQRRKMLRQSLRGVLGVGAAGILEASGIDPAARAEQLTLAQWAALTRESETAR